MVFYGVTCVNFHILTSFMTFEIFLILYHPRQVMCCDLKSSKNHQKMTKKSQKKFLFSLIISRPLLHLLSALNDFSVRKNMILCIFLTLFDQNLARYSIFSFRGGCGPPPHPANGGSAALGTGWGEAPGTGGTGLSWSIQSILRLLPASVDSVRACRA